MCWPPIGFSICCQKFVHVPILSTPSLPHFLFMTTMLLHMGDPSIFRPIFLALGLVEHLVITRKVTVALDDTTNLFFLQSAQDANCLQEQQIRRSEEHTSELQSR